MAALVCMGTWTLYRRVTIGVNPYERILYALKIFGLLSCLKSFRIAARHVLLLTVVMFYVQTATKYTSLYSTLLFRSVLRVQ